MHKLFIIIGLMLCLSPIAYAIENLSIQAQNIYYSMNTPSITFNSSKTLIDCTFYINDVKQLENFDIDTEKTILINTNGSINVLKIVCWDEDISGWTTVIKETYVYQYPVFLWSLLLSPLLLIADVILIIPVIPLIFFQVIPIYYLNDIAFIIYCLSIFIFAWKEVITKKEL